MKSTNSWKLRQLKLTMQIFVAENHSIIVCTFKQMWNAEKKEKKNKLKLSELVEVVDLRQ